MKLAACLALSAGSLVPSLVAGCAPTNTSSPMCTSETRVQPYGDAGLLPPRALPNGFPCATGAVCYATIDDCPGDWPEDAGAPVSASVATPFACDCIQAVWACEAQTESPPACPAGTTPMDAGVADTGPTDAGAG